MGDGIPESALSGDALPAAGLVRTATPVPDDAVVVTRLGPGRWPLKAEERAAMAWWVAAQIVRTVRQRKRLQHLTGEGTRSAGDVAVDQVLGWP